MTAEPTGARRAQAHADTVDRIVAAARALLGRGEPVSLRAVARELGMTAPALYRYAASHEDLVLMVAIAIDAAVAERIAAAAARQPADDPAARLLAAAVEFRRWALANRLEFNLVFTNVDVDCLVERQSEDSTGMVFSGLLFELWTQRRFPVPALADLDLALAEILRDPQVPADLSGMPEEMRGLVWVLQQSWARLYGVVTLEVYGHIDPRMVEHAFLFRTMIEDQAEPLGLGSDLPRLRALVERLLAEG